MRNIKSKRPKRLKVSYLRRFINHVVFCMSIASMHGIVHVVRPRRLILERIFWIGIVAGSSAAVGIQAMKIWDRYTKNPVIITVDKTFSDWQIPFTSVIVCQNKPSLLAKKYLSSTMSELNVSKDALSEYFSDITFSTYYTYKNLEKYANGSVRELMPTSRYTEVISQWASRMDTKKKRYDPLTHPFDHEIPVHFVLSELGPCDYYHSEIAPYLNLTNSDYSNVTSDFTPILINYPSAAAIVTFNDMIKQTYNLYLEYFNEVVDITSLPVIEVTKTQIVELEYSIYIVESDKSLHSLTPVQRNCKFMLETDNIHHNVIYSYKVCRMECRMKLCMKLCHCTPIYYKRFHKEPICNMTGLFCLSKYSEILISLENGTKKLCSCYQNCNTAVMQITPASVNGWDFRSILKVGFYTFPTIRYVRTQVYTGTDVLVQIGGLLGFFLGASLLSLVEGGYFAILRCYWAVFGRRQIRADLQ